WPTSARSSQIGSRFWTRTSPRARTLRRPRTKRNGQWAEIADPARIPPPTPAYKTKPAGRPPAGFVRKTEVVDGSAELGTLRAGGDGRARRRAASLPPSGGAGSRAHAPGGSALARAHAPHPAPLRPAHPGAGLRLERRSDSGPDRRIAQHDAPPRAG